VDELKTMTGADTGSRLPMAGSFGRNIEQLCYGLCVAGGLVLVAGLGIALASVAGRMLTGLGLGPILGDSELMEAACVISGFAFLPWCQLKNGHVSVDILVSHLGRRAGLAVSSISDFGMALVALLIAWRLWINLAEKYAYGDTTMLLQMPVWLTYLASFVGSVCFVLACLVTLSRHMSELFSSGERQAA
jgi:TRAP-type C4-dicarboxylate transport system permease small subunit